MQLCGGADGTETLGLQPRLLTFLGMQVGAFVCIQTVIKSLTAVSMCAITLLQGHGTVHPHAT